MLAPPKPAVFNTVATGKFLQRWSHQCWVEQLNSSSSPSHTPPELWSHEASWRRGRPTRQLFIAMQLWDSSLHFLLGKSQPANRDLTVEQCMVTCQAPLLLPPTTIPITTSHHHPTPRLNKLYHLPPGRLAVAEARRHRGWWVSSGHKGRSPLKAQLCLWLPDWAQGWDCRWCTTFWATFSPQRFFSIPFWPEPFAAL